MKHPWPHFKLTRVMSDGSREAVVLPVHKLTMETRVGRRAFFGVGGAAATLGTLAVAGCGQTATTEEAPAATDTSMDTDTSMAPSTDTSGSYDTSTTSYATDTPYNPPPPPPPPSSDSGSSGGETISQPCTAEPVPAGYECTCNCVEE